MKTPLIAVTLLSLALASGCDRDRSDDQTAMADSMPASDTSAPADAAVTTDANADANSMTADGAAMPQDGKMPGGDAAQTGDVLDYARMMEKEHGDNLAKTQSLGSPADGSDVQALKDKGAKELQTLDAASGEAYEKAYIDAMVKGHQEALDAIDNKMIPAATTDVVKQHLTDTRTHVAAHLDKAKAIAARQ